jgi:aldehyde dehydrogenase (NAD+)
MSVLASEKPSVIVSRLRSTFRAGRTKPVAWRTGQLGALRSLLVEQGKDLAAALYADLGKSEEESFLTEIDYVIEEVDIALRNLDEWLVPQAVPVPAQLPGATAQTVLEPLGVVLVLGPWNFPVHALLVPVVGALAAGNCVVVKPSDVAPATSAALARLLPRYLDNDGFAVVVGGVPEATVLLEQEFDHIFFTGTGATGRIVMRAAAQTLTPVTLELGGKSPVFVDRGTDPATVAARLAATKFFGAGQMCHGPDYVITDPETARSLAPALRDAVHTQFGPDPSASPGFARIVNEHHFDRLTALLGSGRTVVGGDHDRDTLYIAPTVLAEVSPDAPVMGEEIFGPILPIVEADNLDHAIDFINNRDKPLALYAFTDAEATRERLRTETSSGTLAFGMPVLHVTVHELPFGGVGASGMGAFHSRHSLETFSHRKAVFSMPLG